MGKIENVNISKQQQRWALLWISISLLFSLSLWYSASVILPELKTFWKLTENLEGLVSASVPIGFVIGAFISSYFGLADKYNPRKIFIVSAILGGTFNGMLIFIENGMFGLVVRILTGITIAGIYPVSVKILSQWYPRKRGIAIGILIGALTLGTSVPHFIAVFFLTLNWKLIIICSSMLAFVSAIIVGSLLKDAPVPVKNNPFSFKFLKKVVTNKPVMFANYGYFGHMWELYAMWTWLPVFLTSSFQIHNPETSPWLGSFFSFTSIGLAGAVGCIVGGFLAERIGKANLTIIAMTISSSCALVIGFTFGLNIWLTLILSTIWGVFVIADSAQFSASVSEFSEVEYVGTALTFQMCVGFIITIISINIIPAFLNLVGWEWTFTILAIGPLLGIIAMFKLKRFESAFIGVKR